MTPLDSRYTRQRRWFFLRTYTVLLVAAAVLGSSTPVRAQIGECPWLIPVMPFVPFGGRAVETITCTCMPGCFLIYLGPPSMFPVMYCLETPQCTSMWYNFWPPSWQKGNAFPEYTPCMVYAGSSCVPIGGGPLIYMKGSSLY